MLDIFLYENFKFLNNLEESLLVLEMLGFFFRKLFVFVIMLSGIVDLLIFLFIFCIFGRGRNLRV